MNDKQALHFDFLLDQERKSPSQLRLRFIVPVLGVVCLLAPLVVWLQESSRIIADASTKQLLAAEIANLKASHELFLKEGSELRELTAQLQQLEFYRKSKNPVGITLANLTNCVSSRLQLTKLELVTQTTPPFNGPRVRPKSAVDLAKLCPTNQLEGVTLRILGRSIQAGGNPAEVNRFLQALQGAAFASLLDTSSKPKVSFREEGSSSSPRPGEGNQQEVVSFEISYECLPRRFQ